MEQYDAAPSFFEWLEWAEEMAYGRLRLMPEQLYKLTPMELGKMLYAYEKQLELERWDMAYWVANMVSVHTKRPVQPQTLMAPLLPKKTPGEKKKEAQEFFRSFREQQKRPED